LNPSSCAFATFSSSSSAFPRRFFAVIFKMLCAWPFLTALVSCDRLTGHEVAVAQPLSEHGQYLDGLVALLDDLLLAIGDVVGHESRKFSGRQCPHDLSPSSHHKPYVQDEAARHTHDGLLIREIFIHRDPFPELGQDEFDAEPGEVRRECLLDGVLREELLASRTMMLAAWTNHTCDVPSSRPS
jgi:hypothetical protein